MTTDPATGLAWLEETRTSLMCVRLEGEELRWITDTLMAAGAKPTSRSPIEAIERDRLHALVAEASIAIQKKHADSHWFHAVGQLLIEGGAFGLVVYAKAELPPDVQAELAGFDGVYVDVRPVDEAELLAGGSRDD